MVAWTATVKVSFRITTLTTMTPWSKTFDSGEELWEWTKSMDIADGWVYHRGIGGLHCAERFIEIQGKKELTHRVEVEWEL